MKAKFFRDRAAFHRWLDAHHETDDLLVVGFYRKASGKASITPPEALDEALCFGWIDSIRRTIDEESYEIRFTRRKPASAWSAVNIKRAKELVELDRMRPAGLRAFEQRDEAAAQRRHDERATAALDAEMEREFRRNARAWAYFQAQTPSYRRLASCWVNGAKKDETRRSRLATLIEDSAHGRTIKAWPRPAKRD